MPVKDSKETGIFIIWQVQNVNMGILHVWENCVKDLNNQASWVLSQN